MTITAHNSLCSTRAYHLRIDLAHDATVGNVACNSKKIPTHTQDLSKRCIATRGGECVYVQSRLKAEVLDNAVDVVELLLALMIKY